VLNKKVNESFRSEGSRKKGRPFKPILSQNSRQSGQKGIGSKEQIKVGRGKGDAVAPLLLYRKPRRVKQPRNIYKKSEKKNKPSRSGRTTRAE